MSKNYLIFLSVYPDITINQRSRMISNILSKFDKNILAIYNCHLTFYSTSVKLLYVSTQLLKKKKKHSRCFHIQQQLLYIFDRYQLTDISLHIRKFGKSVWLLQSNLIWFLQSKGTLINLSHGFEVIWKEYIGHCHRN